jgi:hypothetical protein
MPLVAIIYDIITRQVVEVVNPAPAKRDLRPNERIIYVALSFYNSFSSMDDLIAALPQVAP